ncbi:hypothetical protein [Oceanicoccus sp. KOV_DT_Chl]|uniref:hypothetical protein n=1 Tax=Oceanicoccus sp. KOV_DT_Chl TaxID=1904639 RepID=UPI00190EA6C9|nr:hypothetical protein [Oceanicoccus sp. KOV_DT_Chl]
MHIFKNKTSYLIRAGFISFVLAAISTSVSAAMITVSWSGTVTSTGVAGLVDIGDTITGYYSYDDATTDTDFVYNPDADSNSFVTNHNSYFSVSGYSGYTSGNHIFVADDFSLSVGDQFDSRGADGTYFGDSIGASSVTQVFVRFNDSTAGAMDNSALPSYLDSADFDNPFVSRIDGPDIRFAIDNFSFAAAAVPVPASAWLFASGLLSLIGIARRRFR